MLLHEAAILFDQEVVFFDSALFGESSPTIHRFTDSDTNRPAEYVAPENRDAVIQSGVAELFSALSFPRDLFVIDDPSLYRSVEAYRQRNASFIAYDETIVRLFAMEAVWQKAQSVRNKKAANDPIHLLMEPEEIAFCADMFTNCATSWGIARYINTELDRMGGDEYQSAEARQRYVHTLNRVESSVIAHVGLFAGTREMQAEFLQTCFEVAMEKTSAK